MPANAQNRERPTKTRAGDLDTAARERLERDWRLSMSERLERVHELCKQMTTIAGAAKRE
jgi:hypothetical protein